MTEKKVYLEAKKLKKTYAGRVVVNDVGLRVEV